MISSIITIAALASTALSAPVVPRDTTSRNINTGMMALRSASPIHFASINATDNNFWIYRETTTFCPYSPPEQECKYSNATEISIYPDATQYQAYMYANVPGGQNVYVAPDGALSFTSAHGEYVFPDGSYTTGFDYTTNENNVSLLTFTENGAPASWLACPASKETPTSYKVYADIAGFKNAKVPTGDINDCLGMGIEVASPEYSSKTLPAWQYE